MGRDRVRGGKKVGRDRGTRWEGIGVRDGKEVGRDRDRGTGWEGIGYGWEG